MSSHRRISRGYSLIFDLEMEENGEPPNFEVRPNINKIKERFFTVDTQAEQQLVDQCGLISQQILANKQNWVRVEAFCEKLRSVGQEAWMRTCFWDKKNEEAIHKFIIVSLNGVEYMVDPNYKREFCLGNEQPWFTKLCDALPPVLVANFDMAVLLLEVLVQEMQIQFLDLGINIPPWREEEYMLARWKSKYFEDDRSSHTDETNDTKLSTSSFTPKLQKDYNYINNNIYEKQSSALTSERLASVHQN